ncbi:MAG: alkaline phosphatase family protein [Rubrobacteraceae bacterium]|nr:alkaline phosphatase family protein [Rubrobacteraceae bacterium]MCL6438671.1 alkaline phosphatase family protein [Rubrobacteraceae bacterium]
MKKLLYSLALAAVLVALAAVGAMARSGPSGERPAHRTPPHRGSQTTTPIKHVVVIFQENVSFDHYFGTYPNAKNPPGEPAFHARKNTPSVNGLNETLQAPNNPNSVQPFRLDRSQFETCDQDHGYTAEQQAFDAGLMDRFVETVGRGDGGCKDYGKGPGLVMGYYDGNTVTALWNYAQHFAMSDNSYGTTFGPSSPGAINLISGQTHGFAQTSPAVSANGTMIGDPQPAGDKCDTRDTTKSIDPKNKNIGDLLNAKNVTWGWFEGGFRDCNQSHANMAGIVSKDYIPHHEPFQYYPSTANPDHLPPSSVAMIGKTDRANHQYDLSDFWAAARHGNLPAVSFLKAPAYQDGHAYYSDPLDEQEFLVNTINRLQKLPAWKDMAIIIAYDDSDGWYDHQMGPIVNQSNDPQNDALSGTSCGSRPENVMGGYQDRCGYGPRLPLLVISPYAKQNFVDHTVTDQTSILRFIEDNWNLGRIGNHSFDAKAGSLLNMFDFSHGRRAHRLFLDPKTGEPSRGSHR